eukprot:jgi/Picsp_1/3483/NSC_06321-R1_---NA---
MAPPEVPLIAEWTRGSAGGPSGLSIGYAPESGMPMGGGQAGRQPEGGTPQGANASVGNPPSQYATVHIAGRTASMAGASMGQGVARPKPQRSSSEGTVQVMVGNKQYAASSVEAQQADIMPVRNGIVVEGHENLDTLSVASKVLGDDARGSGPVQEELLPQECNKSHGSRPAVAMHDVNIEGTPLCEKEKPTESLSSAAAGVQPGNYAAAIATAASLVSQNTGGRMIRDDKIDAMMPKSIDISSKIPIDTNEALNTPRTMGTASQRAGNNAPALQNNRGHVALRSSKLASAVPGNSSNSGTHAVRDGRESSIKRKGSSKPPMLPPPAQTNVRGVSISQYVALPTGSSAGGGIHVQVDLGHTAEDAVSTVQQPHGFLGEIVCDAVSKASGEDADNDGCTESRVHPNDEGVSNLEENSIRISQSRQISKKKRTS